MGTGVTLSPTFASGTTTYAASVGNAVDEVTVTPTKGATSATIEYLNESDMMLADADDMEAGHQVALAVGHTVIKVKVTAQDGTTTQTYTVTVTRAAAMTPALRRRPVVRGGHRRGSQGRRRTYRGLRVHGQRFSGW